MAMMDKMGEMGKPELGKEGKILDVLVTGGVDFIRAQTANLLLERGYKVRMLDRLFPSVHRNRKKPYYIPGDAEFVLGHVRNKQDWKKS